MCRAIEDGASATTVCLGSWPFPSHSTSILDITLKGQLIPLGIGASLLFWSYDHDQCSYLNPARYFRFVIPAELFLNTNLRGAFIPFGALRRVFKREQ